MLELRLPCGERRARGATRPTLSLGPPPRPRPPPRRGPFLGGLTIGRDSARGMRSARMYYCPPGRGVLTISKGTVCREWTRQHDPRMDRAMVAERYSRPRIRAEFAPLPTRYRGTCEDPEMPSPGRIAPPEGNWQTREGRPRSVTRVTPCDGRVSRSNPLFLTALEESVTM